MNYSMVTPEELPELSTLSQSLGNIPFLPNQSTAALLREGEDIVGFAAVQAMCHAAGSWVHPDFRGQRHTYVLRSMLEDALRRDGIRVYFSIPNTNFERKLFRKYGPVKERTVQIKELV